MLISRELEFNYDFVGENLDIFCSNTLMSCIQPLPEVAETDTLLNVQYNEEVKELFKRQHPFFVSKKLQDLTFTTKYQWRPQ